MEPFGYATSCNNKIVESSIIEVLRYTDDYDRPALSVFHFNRWNKPCKITKYRFRVKRLRRQDETIQFKYLIKLLPNTQTPQRYEESIQSSSQD